MSYKIWFYNIGKSMRKILITGSKGMVGRNICEHKGSHKYDVLKPSRKEFDLLDLKNVETYIQNNQPEIIIHAAGMVGGIQANIKDPTKFFYNNLQMGLNLVKTARKAGIKNLLNIASSCMYPRNGINPLEENSILSGDLEPTNEGYALAKICIERLCKYISLEDTNYVYKTLVPCNIFGKHDKFTPGVAHMLPAVIYRMHQAKINNIDSIKIWGNGKARREFMYSEDLADAIWFCLEKILELPQTINIGMSMDHTIKEYYEAVALVLKCNFNFEFDLSKPVGMNRKLVDSSLINKLGWKPNFDLNNGIKLTYDHFVSTYVENI